MPIEDYGESKINPAERRGLQQWLDEKSGSQIVCPVSHDSHWTIPEFKARIYIDVSTGRAGNYPVVPLICGTCGFMMFFSTVRVGLEDPEEKGGTDA